MKIMAVDYGDARTGLAVCDRTEFLASPVGQIEEKSMAKVAEKIIYASREYGVGMIVIGLPKNMDGTEGARAEKTRKLAVLQEENAALHQELEEARTSLQRARKINSHFMARDKRERRKVRVSEADMAAPDAEMLPEYFGWPNDVKR